MFRMRLVVASLMVPTVVGAIEREPQAPPPAIAATSPGETQELVVRDGMRARGQVERVEGGRVTFRATASAVIGANVARMMAVRSVAGRRGRSRESGRLSTDLGLVVPLGLDSFVAFPMFDVVWRLARD